MKKFQFECVETVRLASESQDFSPLLSFCEFFYKVVANGDSAENAADPCQVSQLESYDTEEHLLTQISGSTFY